MARPRGAARYDVFEGFSVRSKRTMAAPTLEEAIQNLWDNAKAAGLKGPAKLRIVEIEIYGSNPIDMFHVIGSRH